MIVLDTNVVSYIFSGDSLAEYYLDLIHGRRTIISFQTLEELLYGAYNHDWGARRRDRLARHLEQYDVVWPGRELADACARLRSERKAAGREMQIADAWVAATAILLKCPLASHDRDFAAVPGLDLVQAPEESR